MSPTGTKVDVPLARLSGAPLHYPRSPSSALDDNLSVSSGSSPLHPPAHDFFSGAGPGQGSVDITDSVRMRVPSDLSSQRPSSVLMARDCDQPTFFDSASSSNAPSRAASPAQQVAAAASLNDYTAAMSPDIGVSSLVDDSSVSPRAARIRRHRPLPLVLASSDPAAAASSIPSPRPASQVHPALHADRALHANTRSSVLSGSSSVPSTVPPAYRDRNSGVTNTSMSLSSPGASTSAYPGVSVSTRARRDLRGQSLLLPVLDFGGSFGGESGTPLPVYEEHPAESGGTAEKRKSVATGRSSSLRRSSLPLSVPAIQLSPSADEPHAFFLPSRPPSANAGRQLASNDEEPESPFSDVHASPTSPTPSSPLSPNHNFRDGNANATDGYPRPRVPSQSSVWRWQTMSSGNVPHPAVAQWITAPLSTHTGTSGRGTIGHHSHSNASLPLPSPVSSSFRPPPSPLPSPSHLSASYPDHPFLTNAPAPEREVEEYAAPEPKTPVSSKAPTSISMPSPLPTPVVRRVASRRLEAGAGTIEPVPLPRERAEEHEREMEERRLTARASLALFSPIHSPNEEDTLLYRPATPRPFSPPLSPTSPREVGAGAGGGTGMVIPTIRIDEVAPFPPPPDPADRRRRPKKGSSQSHGTRSSKAGEGLGIAAADAERGSHSRRRRRGPVIPYLCAHLPVSDGVKRRLDGVMGGRRGRASARRDVEDEDEEEDEDDVPPPQILAKTFFKWGFLFPPIWLMGAMYICMSPPSLDAYDSDSLLRYHRDLERTSTSALAPPSPFPRGLTTHHPLSLPLSPTSPIPPEPNPRASRHIMGDVEPDLDPILAHLRAQELKYAKRSLACFAVFCALLSIALGLYLSFGVCWRKGSCPGS